MNSESAARAYREETITSAPPIKLVRMLYQGALRFLDKALESDPSDPQSAFVDSLARVDAIVTELRFALQKEHAPDVSGSLESLYLFVESQLLQAQVQRSHEALPHARKVLATLSDAWGRVEMPKARIEPLPGPETRA